MREKILAVIEKNSRIDIKDLAVLLGESEIAVANYKNFRYSLLKWKSPRWKKSTLSADTTLSLIGITPVKKK